MVNKLGKSGQKICIAVVAAVIGMILYIVTSTTGYLETSAMNPAPIVLTIIAIILMAAIIGLKNLSPVLSDLLMVAAAVFLMISLAYFVLGRVSLAADIYFIPVNYPPTEETALNRSIIGVVFYLISILTMIILGFTAKDER